MGGEAEARGRFHGALWVKVRPLTSSPRVSWEPLRGFQKRQDCDLALVLKDPWLLGGSRGEQEAGWQAATVSWVRGQGPSEALEEFEALVLEQREGAGVWKWL